jgi:hypothetical protein
MKQQADSRNSPFTARQPEVLLNFKSVSVCGVVLHLL